MARENKNNMNIAKPKAFDNPVCIPSAIIGHDLGAAKSIPEYMDAKSGSNIAGVAVAKALITSEFLDRIKEVAGELDPIIQPVYAIEALGVNIIPQICGKLVGKRLGLQVGDEILQSNSPKRTSMPGLERVFNRPTFAGAVESGRSYILLDDTLTQGGTFAALERHIVSGGGRVIAAIALTGKQYSATLQISNETLIKLRGLHGDVENYFREETGRGFGDLTESEARYLAGYKPAVAVRDRIVQGANQAKQPGIGPDAAVSLSKAVALLSSPRPTTSELAGRLTSLLQVQARTKKHKIRLA